ncbi:MAG: hypothetical protein PHY56_06510 [Candidatus Omnitrophica bacterium]|nr:hypothetical protein [Candidatus Omnitrophota bacterium]
MDFKTYMRKYFFISLAWIILFAPLVAGAIEIKPPIKSTTLYDFLNGLKGVSLKIVLPIAVITILVAAFFLLRAGGDSTAADKGKKILTAGLGGMALVIVGAGLSALLMNIFGIRSPGITSAPLMVEAEQSLAAYLKETNDPTLQNAKNFQESLEQCSPE